MRYFTTMNLPAPSHAQFYERLHQYTDKPEAAVHDFEVALKAFFEVEAVATFTNCFTALAIALLYAARGRARKVAIAGQAYRRTTDIVLWAGMQPVYIDNSPDTLCMSEESLIQTLNQMEIGCVLVQHPMVKICDITRFLEIGKHYGVPIVFDSVEATGARFNGKRIGRFGITEGFSLHPSKVINAAEGGVLTFGNKEEYHSFRQYLIEIGILCQSTGKYLIFGLEPLHAILGLASLEIYEESRAKFKEHYLRYQSNLRTSQMLELVLYESKCKPNYKTILAKIHDPERFSKAKLLAYLESLHIGVRAYYSPLHPLTENIPLPQAKKMANEYLFLPIGHSVNIEDIDFICDQITKFEAENNDARF